MNNFRNIILLFVLGISLCFKVNGQKVFRDTTVIFDPCYNENVQICEMLVPDSTYNVLMTTDYPTQTTTKYNLNCYYLIPESKGSPLYSYKDFELCIGNKCFEYSFPQYDYSLDRNFLIENLNTTHLKNIKSGELMPLEQLILVFTNKVNFKNSKVLELDNINVSDKKLLYSSGAIGIKVPSFSFNYVDKRYNCLNNVFHFPVLDFNLWGRDKYPELLKN